jgi:SAM-dependent methyltransferase
VSAVFHVEGDAYDEFMGRYSKALAPLFADFAGIASGVRALDVGAGTGALTGELLSRGANASAVEPSPEFVAVLRQRFPDVDVREAPAEHLPFPEETFDVAMAQLVVAFLADAPAAMREMVRVARRVAVCMWGIAEVDMFAAIDRTAKAIGVPRAAEEQARRFRTPRELRELLAPHGTVAEQAELDVSASYHGFDDFWHALDRRVGPAGHWLASLAAGTRDRAREELFRQLGRPRGPFELHARAFAVAVTRA